MYVSESKKVNGFIHLPRLKRCERAFEELPMKIPGIEVPELDEQEIEEDLLLAQHMKELRNADLRGDHLCCVLVSESEEAGMLAAVYLAARHGGVAELDSLKIPKPEGFEDDTCFEEEVCLEHMLPIYELSSMFSNHPLFFDNVDNTFSNNHFVVRKGKSLRLPHWAEIENRHPLLIRVDGWNTLLFDKLQKQVNMRSLTILLLVNTGEEEGLEKVASQSMTHDIVQELWFCCAADVLQIKKPSPSSAYTKAVFHQMMEENGLLLQNPSHTGELLRRLESFRNRKGGASNENVFRYVNLLAKMYGMPLTEEPVMLSRTQAIKPLQLYSAKRKTATEKQDVLWGCEAVKRQLRAVVDQMLLQDERRKRNLPAQSHGQVLLFAGAPGTGKSTAARMLHDWLSQNGLVCNAEWEDGFFQISGAQLKARYVGHTAPMIHEMFESHSFLFIDEAYALAESGEEGGNNDHFAQEAMAQLCVELENLPPDRVVIFAGYGGCQNNRMRSFLNANPGLASRITTTIQFDAYDPEKELPDIFMMQAERMELSLPREWRKIAVPYFHLRAQQADYGSGREARRLLECCLISQARRLAAQHSYKIDDLCRLRESDIREAVEDLENGFRALREEAIGQVGLALT